MKACVVLVCVTGCGFSVGASTSDAGPGDDVIDPAIDAPVDQTMIDAPPSAFGDIDLIPPAEERAAPGNWTANAVTLNTSTLTSTVALPPDVTFTMGLQDNGDEVAFLRVNDFKLNSGQILRVLGTRPFVIVCGHDCTIDGTIDISARLRTPGAGGSVPAVGMGKGGNGVHFLNGDDGGGGGGGYGSPGGAGGGTVVAEGGSGGLTYPMTALVGGSGGGGPEQGIGCSNVGGGGGGAILIYAKHKLTFQGSIDAGGGGGEAGVLCTNPSNWGAGAGGGAGGMIYLQTPDLNGSGIAVTNGGGGGGGNCSTGTLPEHGQNAQTSLTTAAQGGGGSDCGTPGGRGAIGTMAATASQTSTTNGGGGGGGVGRVIIHAPGAVSVQGSPPAVIIP